MEKNHIKLDIYDSAMYRLQVHQYAAISSAFLVRNGSQLCKRGISAGANTSPARRTCTPKSSGVGDLQPRPNFDVGDFCARCTVATVKGSQIAEQLSARREKEEARYIEDTDL